MTETHAGGCHCGAIRYEVQGSLARASLCHCSDCRRAAGAPVVAWVGVSESAFRVTKGTAKTRNSSGASIRNFCPDCGTGLWFTNAELLPGIVDIQSATLDDPNAAAPATHIQVAERISWMEHIHALPAFERWPDGA